MKAIDLLTVAKELAHGSTEAHWRRSTSTAYYAVFHLLIEETISLLGLSSFPGSNLISRSFVHQRMEKVSKDFTFNAVSKFNAQEVSPELVKFTTAFVELKDGRIKSDYEVTLSPFNQEDAFRHLKEASDGFELWASVKDTECAKLYLLLLLVGDEVIRNVNEFKTKNKQVKVKSYSADE